MKKKCFFPILLILLFSRGFTVGAQSLQSAFDSAYAQWSDTLFREVEKQAENNLYWRSVAGFHRVNFYLYGFDRDRNKKKALRCMDRVLTDLQRIPSGAPHRAELFALRATLRGIRITLRPLSGPVAGPKVQQDLDRAMAADSTNPRVLYLLGVSYYHMPKLFGGGFEKSRPYLLRSVRFFAEERNRGTETRWGYSTALSFLGEIHVKQGQYAAARGWYTKALKVNPRDGLARRGLAQLGQKGK
ncbi:MAG: tetratricopeptide repeat protein [Fibrobacterota bacterium]